MVEKRNDMKKLIDEAIDASMKFEELMDKTDFDSWLIDDNSDKLEELGQDPTPFEKFETDIKELRRICCQIKNKWGAERRNPQETSANEILLISELFDAKIKRVEARICSQKEDGEEKYKEALFHLLSALNRLQLPEENNIDKRWLILLYNDLSICYAGLENSSMSRGYAQEARWLIEKKEKNYAESYKKFCQELDNNNTAKITNIKNHDFVSSKLYALYNVAVYNQAVAEKRSYNYSDAEKNFRKVISFAEKTENIITPIFNFNYYSTLFNLSDLYIDLGRGEEAIELLKKIKEDENDIRYWNVCIAKINALIDQSKYEDANEELYKNIIEKKNGYTLNRRHKITSTGFKGLNCFVRCIIDSARNDLKRIDEKKECELKKAVEFINKNEGKMQERNQKGSFTKAYRQLSDIYKILSKEKDDIKYDKDIRKYLIKFISENEFISVDQIDDLDTFISDTKKMGKWIDKCDDLDALESFTYQVIKVIKEEIAESDYNINQIDKFSELFKKIEEKIRKECEDKNQLARAEKIVKQIDEILGGKKDLKYRENIFPPKKSTNTNKLTKEYIRKRLDINEKEFDSILFERSEIEEDHIAEVIILRRWNSFSPGLFREFSGSLGGGYLIRINRKNLGQDNGKGNWRESVENIVIDPGYNFLQNFHREGFNINDIDTIIVTHSHPDHCSELIPIMDLLYQFNKRLKDTPYKDKQTIKKRINLCLSQGAYKKFSNYINDPDWKKQLKDVIILENLKEGECAPFNGLTISAIPTPHWDLGGAHSIGLKIEINKGNKRLCLGFTGDTPWSQEIKDHFKKCDLLCIHLGSLKYQEIGYTEERYNTKSRKIKIKDREKEFKKKFLEANHLLFHGTLDFMEYCAQEKESIIILGEFGEELKYGLRTGIYEELSKAAKPERKKNKIPDFICLPGDIGLYIRIYENRKKKVRCNLCGEFVEQKEIETFSYGREDAIHYICKTCGNTLTDLQKQAVIEHRLTRH